MAKKKRRYRRNHRPRKFNPSASDRHHLCWTKKQWDRGIYQAFRKHPYCIVVIPRDTLHRYIHYKIGQIPAPRFESVRLALARLEYLERLEVIRCDDSIERRLEVLASLFEYSDPDTAGAFKKQLRIVREYNKSSQN